jgi:hypothetical protein
MGGFEMLKRLIPIIAISLVASGCTNLNKAVRDEQKIPVTVLEVKDKLGEGGAVYLWPPYSSAALVDGKGNRCVLAASGAKTVDASSEAALKIGEAFEKIKGLEASEKSRILEMFTKLSAADSQAAFTDVALFHLCILDQNGSFAERKKDKDTGEWVDHKFKANLIMDAYLKTIQAAKETKQ